MHTDMLKVSTLLLAAALLAGPAPAEAQGADVNVESPAPSPPGRPGVSVRTGNQVVETGDVVEGDLVVHDGDLRIEGKVGGNVVVTGGDLTIAEGAEVLGDAKVIGGSLVNEGGRVLGEMVTLSDEDGEDEAHAPHAPRAPREPAMVAGAPEHERSSWFGPILRGFSDVLSTMALGLVLAGLGAGLIFYGLPYLRTVSDTLRKSTGRSAAVGMAATFLVLPAFILLVVALAVSIVGIPLLLVAVPLYPVAVLAAFGFGLLAAAHAVGERTAEQREGFDLRHRNAYTYLFTGLGILLAPLLTAALVEMVGFLDWVSVLLKILAFLALWGVATVGMGAVILSRAGTRRTFTGDLEPPTVLDDDPFFDSEPALR
ncbi:MAG: hypothetical protein M3P24_11945 [Gemmatimonadota bacterium]|nr:hypothetical protein [Gemmatimonadota bacterium]